MQGVDIVLHTAALHKPHVATHSRQDFVDVNVSGTLNLLEEAVAAGVPAFVYTSTTSVFGDALRHILGTKEFVDARVGIAEQAVDVVDALAAEPGSIGGGEALFGT